MKHPEALEDDRSRSTFFDLDITQLFRPIIREFADSYTAVPSLEEIAKELGLPIEDIAKLDAGENPYIGFPEISVQQIAEQLAYYPDPSARKLREALAPELGVSPEMIAIGNGSDELIDLICRLFLESGRKLVDFAPTFPMYKMFAKVAGAEVVEVPRTAEFQLHKDSVKVVAKGDLVFLANPNNPTGTVIDIDEIKKLLDTGKPIVVDEAYYEFYGETVVPLLKHYGNLIVLRTFSKWAGIAGLRIGYAVANPQIIEKINAIKAPYNTNFIAQAIAQEVQFYKREYLLQIEEQVWARDQFIENVNSLAGWTAVPSQASCLCISSDKFSATDLTSFLRLRGILVRNISKAIPNTIRISIAPHAVMDRVFSALVELDSTV